MLMRNNTNRNRKNLKPQNIWKEITGDFDIDKNKNDELESQIEEHVPCSCKECAKNRINLNYQIEKSKLIDKDEDQENLNQKNLKNNSRIERGAKVFSERWMFFFALVLIIAMASTVVCALISVITTSKNVALYSKIERVLKTNYKQ